MSRIFLLCTDMRAKLNIFLENKYIIAIASVVKWNKLSSIYIFICEKFIDYNIVSFDHIFCDSKI